MAPPLTLVISVPEAELFHDGQGLHGEGLIQFNQADIVQGQTGPGQSLAGGRDRAQAHDSRLYPRGR